MTDLLAAHAHCSNHRAEIEASSICGCFNCLQIFPASEIVAWSGAQALSLEDLEAAEGTTAMCPHCGSESVIGDRSGYRIDLEFLRSMSEAWLQRTIVRRPAKKPT